MRFGRGHTSTTSAQLQEKSQIASIFFDLFAVSRGVKKQAQALLRSFPTLLAEKLKLRIAQQIIILHQADDLK